MKVAEIGGIGLKKGLLRGDERKAQLIDYFFFLPPLADFFDFFFQSITSSQDFICLGLYPRLGILWHLLALPVWPGCPTQSQCL